MTAPLEPMLSLRLGITFYKFFIFLIDLKKRNTMANCAKQIPRGRLIFIADYLEDPKMTENQGLFIFLSLFFDGFMSVCLERFVK